MVSSHYWGIMTEPIQFFQDPKYIMPVSILCVLWSSLGTSFLSFIGGLQGIDKSLYEAGAVDGIRNRWQELWYITLPQMRTAYDVWSYYDYYPIICCS